MSSQEHSAHFARGVLGPNHYARTDDANVSCYEDHPLRKDFPLTGFPVGIDTLKD